MREFDELEKEKRKGGVRWWWGKKMKEKNVIRGWWKKKKSYGTARVRNRMGKIRYFGSCEKK